MIFRETSITAWKNTSDEDHDSELFTTVFSIRRNFHIGNNIGSSWKKEKSQAIKSMRNGWLSRFYQHLGIMSWTIFITWQQPNNIRS